MPVGKGSLARAAKSAVKKEAPASAKCTWSPSVPVSRKAEPAAEKAAPAARKSPGKKEMSPAAKKSPAKKGHPAAEKEAAVNTPVAAAVITPEDGEKFISGMICDLPIYLL